MKVRSFFLVLILSFLLPGSAESNGLSSIRLKKRQDSTSPTLFVHMDTDKAGFKLSPTQLPTPLKKQILQSRSSSIEDSFQGVCIGDYDDDGRADIFLSHPYGNHKLYRNLGEFQFADVTKKAGVENLELWGRGASFIDIDNDGDLDLHVCGNGSPNALYVNQGNGTFLEKANEFGLDFKGFSIMSYFADYDLDGDLDVYLVTNQDSGAEANMHLEMNINFKNGRAVVPEPYVEIVDVIVHPQDGPRYVLAGQKDHLFRNNGNNTFTDVSEKAGLFGGYQGLSAVWFDYDSDRYPDLFVANDFYGADQLYHNNKDGTFTEVAWQALPHVPWFSMGADAADINNDGLLDLIAPDMSGTTSYKSKMGMGDMEKDLWFLSYSRPRQTMRNAVYLNTGTSRFMEVAYLLGLANSDWSWSAKFGDFDNDGWVDLYICNGMTRDLTNSDFLEEAKRLQTQEERAAFWQAKGLKNDRNLAFRNLGDLRFENWSAQWGLDMMSVSYGAAMGDLDGDGDQDLVVSGIKDLVTLYQNGSTNHHLVNIRLEGTKSNRRGIGAMVRIETECGPQVRYLTTGQGYLSANQPVLHFGLGTAKKIDRLSVVWPSGIKQEFHHLDPDRLYTITEPSKIEQRELESVAPSPLFSEIPTFTNVRHKENPFDDFKIQPLLPNKLSRLGPGIAWGDVDHDGDDDVYIGGAKNQSGQLWINHGAGGFTFRPQIFFKQLAVTEDMAPVFFDADGDGHLDLYVVGGGADFLMDLSLLRDRLYLNDGQGNFTISPSATTKDLTSGSVVASADFDRDGDLDLFVGGRFVPGQYPEVPNSQLLENDKGVFSDVSEVNAPGLRDAGMVTSAIWSDANGDGWQDLLVTYEWGPVRYWQNQEGQLVHKTKEAGLQGRTGFWNGIAARDLDNDGDMDYVVSNLGLNTKYTASKKNPYLAYYGDFEGTGKPRLVEALFEGDTLYPVRGRSCSTLALPHLADQFSTYHEFASASLQEIYSPGKLSEAKKFAVNTLETGILFNDGNAGFSFTPLPRLAQSSPGFGVVATDADADGNADIYLVQNFYGPQPETGRMDGGVSMLLRGDGQGTFHPIRPAHSGLVVSGDAKGLATTDFNEDGWVDFSVTVNDGQVMAFQNNRTAGNHPIVVTLDGHKGNLNGVGSQIRVFLDSGRTLMAEVYGGGGYLSQSSPDVFFGRNEAERMTRIEVRWPDGKTIDYTPNGTETFVRLRPM